MERATAGLGGPRGRDGENRSNITKRQDMVKGIMESHLKELRQGSPKQKSDDG